MMGSFAARLELPKSIWIALAILGFILWWPLGLAILAYLLWSGEMGCCGIGFGNWRDDANRQAQDQWRQPRTSGNQAFDEYWAATLRRLEEEQHEFRGFCRACGQQRTRSSSTNSWLNAGPDPSRSRKPDEFRSGMELRHL
jgi:hypothetical protein